jgi:hypothetical protein
VLTATLYVHLAADPVKDAANRVATEITGALKSVPQYIHTKFPTDPVSEFRAEALAMAVLPRTANQPRMILIRLNRRKNSASKTRLRAFA